MNDVLHLGLRSVKNACQIVVPRYFADGDGYQIYLRKDGNGLILSDIGSLRMRWSFTDREARFDVAVLAREFGVTTTGGAFSKPTTVATLAEDIVEFGNAIEWLEEP